jgi:hypothetical protein
MLGGVAEETVAPGVEFQYAAKSLKVLHNTSRETMETTPLPGAASSLHLVEQRDRKGDLSLNPIQASPSSESIFTIQDTSRNSQHFDCQQRLQSSGAGIKLGPL